VTTKASINLLISVSSRSSVHGTYGVHLKSK
jgi:hypothetical protein